MDSVGPDFEEYFNVNGVDDGDGEEISANSLAQAMAQDRSRAEAAASGDMPEMLARRPSTT